MSIVVPTGEAPVYLDQVLTKLSLDVRNRAEFITYWLEKIQSEKFVALSFLPQVEYAQAAVLQVEPHPDVITRIFLLFKPLVELDDGWTACLGRDIDWVSVVGISPVANDSTVFRVVEWGGMMVNS